VRALDRKLLRDLWRAKGMLLAILSIIAVGVMCFVSMQSAYQNLSRAKLAYYAQCRMADFWIDLDKAPASDLDRVRRLPGVARAETRIQYLATVDLPGYAGAVNGQVVSMPDRRVPVLNDIVMRRGHYFTPRRMNEVILNDAFAREHKLAPGDWISLLLKNGRERLFVVGTAISSEHTYLLGPGEITPNPKHFGVFYIKRSFAEEVFDLSGAANQIIGKMLPGQRDRIDTTLEMAEDQLEEYGVFATTPLRLQASNQFLTSEINGLWAFATVVPGVFLAVAALVLNVLLMRLVRQQRTIVGTLKAVGYSDRQVLIHYLKFGVWVGVVGGVLGGLLGYWSSTGMTTIYKQFFEFPDLRSGFHWQVHAIGMTVSVVCAVLGSMHGGHTVMRLRPAEAMRPAPPRTGGRVFLERITWLWSQFSPAWRLAIRTVLRSRLRTAVGLFAAAMGACLLVTGFMMMQAQNYLLEFQFFRSLKSDIEVTYQSDQPLDAVQDLYDIPGVTYAEPQFRMACTFRHGPRHRKGAVTGLPRYPQLTVPLDTSAHRITLPAAGGLVLTRQLAKLLDARVGDIITLEPVKGEQRPVEIPVAKIADSYMGLSAYAEISQLSHLVGETGAMNAAQLSIGGDSADAQQVYRQLKEIPAIQTITSRRDMIKHLTETLIDVQWVFIGSLVMFAGVIFFGSVLNASLVNLAERLREVATLRAIGYGPWRVGRMFLRESLLVNTAGSLLGLPAGYWLMRLVAFAYNNDLIRLPVITAPWVWWTTMGLSVVFALVAHVFVQWRITKMDFLEALKVKE